MNDIKRGEMFYISRGGASYNGSEQHADRPAVVVSNNKNNGKTTHCTNAVHRNHRANQSNSIDGGCSSL